MLRTAYNNEGLNSELMVLEWSWMHSGVHLEHIQNHYGNQTNMIYKIKFFDIKDKDSL